MTYTVTFTEGNDEWHPPIEIKSEYSHTNLEGQNIYIVTVDEKNDMTLERYMDECSTVISYRAE